MKIDDDVLRQLRPPVVPLDPAWSHETLSRVLASQQATGLADAARRRARRTRRVALAAAALSVAGAGAASAGALAPQTFTDAFSSWRDWPGRPASDPAAVEPSRAERVASAPGPDGTVFSVMSTARGGSYSCRTAVIESAASAALPEPPARFTAVMDDFCSADPLIATFGGVAVNYHRLAVGYVVGAGAAVRAEVSTADGHDYPALLVGGDFWGWFPRSARPTLVGYAADGSVVGRVRLG